MIIMAYKSGVYVTLNVPQEWSVAVAGGDGETRQQIEPLLLHIAHCLLS